MNETVSPKFSTGTALLLIVLVVVLAAIPLALNPQSEFAGADSIAESAITEVQPEYEPWFQPLWEPPGGETESLLFALQAGLGGGVIGYFFGVKRAQRGSKL